MVVKDEKFNFLSAKMIGIYLMIISVLVFLHINLVILVQFAIFIDAELF